jgi:hypothetical protein
MGRDGQPGLTQMKKKSKQPHFGQKIIYKKVDEFFIYILSRVDRVAS